MRKSQGLKGTLRTWDLTYDEAAALWGVTRATISGWCAGRMDMSSASSRLYDVLSVLWGQDRPLFVELRARYRRRTRKTSGEKKKTLRG